MESWFSQKEETNGGVESFFLYKEDREESVFRGKKKKINVKWKNEGQFWMLVDCLTKTIKILMLAKNNKPP